MTHGGDTGAAVVPGKSGESLIVEQVASKAMPPGKNPKLSDAQVAILRTWIDAGARGETNAAVRRLGRHGELLGVSAPDSAPSPGGPAGRERCATRSTRSCSPASRRRA